MAEIMNPNSKWRAWIRDLEPKHMVLISFSVLSVVIVVAWVAVFHEDGGKLQGTAFASKTDGGNTALPALPQRRDSGPDLAGKETLQFASESSPKPVPPAPPAAVSASPVAPKVEAPAAPAPALGGPKPGEEGNVQEQGEPMQASAHQMGRMKSQGGSRGGSGSSAHFGNGQDPAAGGEAAAGAASGQYSSAKAAMAAAKGKGSSLKTAQFKRTLVNPTLTTGRVAQRSNSRSGPSANEGKGSTSSDFTVGSGGGGGSGSGRGGGGGGSAASGSSGSDSGANGDELMAQGMAGAAGAMEDAKKCQDADKKYRPIEERLQREMDHYGDLMDYYCKDNVKCGFQNSWFCRHWAPNHRACYCGRYRCEMKSRCQQLNAVGQQHAAACKSSVQAQDCGVY